MRISQISCIVLFTALFSAPAAAQKRAGCTLPSDRPLQSKAEFSPDINTQAFVDTVLNTIGDDMMGYVVLLQSKQGQIIGEINYGFARTPCESKGKQPFTHNTTVTWGSVTKLITAAAAIDRTEQSPRYSLDQRMADNVPQRWEVGQGWKATTIGHLLRYQGGFTGSGSGPLWDRIATTVTERPVGSREYVNANYTAFHYLGRFFVGTTEWNSIESSFRSNEISYHDYLFGKTRSIWKNVLRTRIFDPIDIKGDCDKIDFNGDNYAHYYNSPNSKKGYFINPLDQRNCASGGVTMSVRDMGKFMHALSQTDKIISKENYQSLMSITSNNLVAYNNNYTVADGQAYGKAGGWSPSGASGSAVPGNTASGAVRNYVMAFPNGMTAIFAANSEIPNNEDDWSRRGLLIAAYNAGLAANEPRNPRRPSRD